MNNNLTYLNSHEDKAHMIMIAPIPKNIQDIGIFSDGLFSSLIINN
ncbi:MAG: hypothetical protein NTZ42_02435 [Candidatus Gribaldobacteria bacterium]|nr:hypothetical protein [Candidatus Gribaldobacteria bacterium]